MSARWIDDAELGPAVMPVCVCGCPADEHDPEGDEPCLFCDCDAFATKGGLVSEGRPYKASPTSEACAGTQYISHRLSLGLFDACEACGANSAGTDRSWTPARDEQTPPSRAALTTCLLLLLTGFALLTWHDGRCHTQASTAAGHALCQEIAR